MATLTFWGMGQGFHCIQDGVPSQLPEVGWSSQAFPKFDLIRLTIL
jgi:hypothetical protein